MQTSVIFLQLQKLPQVVPSLTQPKAITPPSQGFLPPTLRPYRQHDSRTIVSNRNRHYTTESWMNNKLTPVGPSLRFQIRNTRFMCTSKLLPWLKQHSRNSHGQRLDWTSEWPDWQLLQLCPHPSVGETETETWMVQNGTRSSYSQLCKLFTPSQSR